MEGDLCLLFSGGVYILVYVGDGLEIILCRGCY